MQSVKQMKRIETLIESGDLFVWLLIAVAVLVMLALLVWYVLDRIDLVRMEQKGLARIGSTFFWNKVGLDWHDVWVGLYWKYQQFFETEDGDYDALTFYICPVPCLLISFTRVREYQVIPQVTKLDPLCLTCKVPHSMHRVNAPAGLGCDTFKG